MIQVPREYTDTMKVASSRLVAQLVEQGRQPSMIASTELVSVVIVGREKMTQRGGRTPRSLSIQEQLWATGTMVC
jgi:hypothetical protein